MISRTQIPRRQIRELWPGKTAPEPLGEQLEPEPFREVSVNWEVKDVCPSLLLLAISCLSSNTLHWTLHQRTTNYEILTL